MIFTVTLNPARDRTVMIPGFEAGKVNRIKETRDDPGGKGINVSKVIAALGGTSVAMGILGGQAGRYIQRCLEDMSIECDFVRTNAETRTNIKVVDPERHVTTDINASGAPASKRVLSRVYRKLESRAKPGDVVVFAGKLAAGMPPEMLAAWIRALERRDVRVFLDADGETLRQGVKAAPYLIKPNESELSGLLGETLKTPEEVCRGARRVMEETGVRFVAVSMGADGALFASGSRAYRGEGLRVNALSTVGAGDSMMAALAWGLDAGLPEIDVCRRALAVSAACVTCTGTQTPPPETIQALYEQARVLEYNPMKKETEA